MTVDHRIGSYRRVTADFPPGTAVFMIGMRINRLREVRRWAQAFLAMPKMLRELAAQPGLGLLGAKTWLGWREVMVVQYWRSLDDLLAYATAADAAHVPAWREFNRRVRAGGSTGVWHEAYVVDPQAAHIVYVNMPASGMAAATSEAPVLAGRPQRAAQSAAGAPGL